MAKKKAIIIKPVPALLATKRITGRSKVVAAAAQKEAARAEDKEEEEEYEDKEADETEEAGEEQAAASEHEEESKDEARLQPATKKRRTAAPAANKSMAEKRPRASNLLKRKAGTTTAARYVASTSKSLSPSSSSSAVSVPQQPAKTPKPKPGTKIVKGLTDCVFIALPSLDDIIAYNTIDNKLKTRGQDQLKDSAAWEKMIEFHYKVTFTTLTSQFHHTFIIFSLHLDHIRTTFSRVCDLCLTLY